MIRFCQEAAVVVVKARPKILLALLVAVVVDCPVDPEAVDCQGLVAWATR